MKVKNLIALLSTYNPEAEFMVVAPSGDEFLPLAEDFKADTETNFVVYEIYDPL